MKNIKKKRNLILTTKSLKHFNLLSKSNILKMTLQLPFVLFFYHDFFDPQERINLHRQLSKYNLQTSIVSTKTIKYTFGTKSLNKLKILLSNKILIIYPKNNKEFSLEALKTLEKNKKIFLIFGIWNGKVYRHIDLNRCIKEYKTIQPKLLQTCYQPWLKLVSLLSFFKTKN